ncbi:MAG: GFA family protein [Deltaproteobacteria bacterium]|nr:MAG: GFA family protein [Deltaproteobacteria bacterium]
MPTGLGSRPTSSCSHPISSRWSTSGLDSRSRPSATTIRTGARSSEDGSGTARHLRFAVSVVPLRLVSHRVLRALAVVSTALARRETECLDCPRDVPCPRDGSHGAQSFSGHANGVRRFHCSRRLPHSTSGGVGLHRVAPGVALSPSADVGMHHRRFTRPPGRVPSRRCHGGHLTHGGAVVRPGLRGSAARHLPCGVLHLAHPGRSFRVAARSDPRSKEVRTMTVLSGGRACGAIRYACTAPALFCLNCHCRDCQRESGSAFVPVMAALRAAFEVVQGTPRYFDLTADSGHTTTRAFCGDCGSSLFGLPGAAPEIVMIRAGSLDEPSSFKPSRLPDPPAS